MPLAQLRAMGYVDEDSLERAEDGTRDFDFSELAWDNFTQADYDKFRSAGEDSDEAEEPDDGPPSQ